MISSPVFALAIPGLSGIGMPELHHHPRHRADPLRAEAPSCSSASLLARPSRSLKDGIEGKLDEGEDATAVDETTAKKAEPASAEAKKPAAPSDKPSGDDA